MKKQICNPLLPLDVCIADSEPHIWGGRLYLIGSHDQPDGDSFCLLDYTFWSAPLDDLSQWSCPGISYSAKQDPDYSEQDRANATGTTHGSIEFVNGRWYVFYHRLTHGTDYSRQTCAEPLELHPDGALSQAEMTSSGMNPQPLMGEGSYPAVCCCHLTNGHMPHIANSRNRQIPMVTHSPESHFIANAKQGTKIRYRWFDLSKTDGIQLTARGEGRIGIYFGSQDVGWVDVSSSLWADCRIDTPHGREKDDILLVVLSGEVGLKTLTLYA